MDSGWNWNLFNNSSSTNGGRGQNGNSTTNPAWDIWDLDSTTSSFDWNNHTTHNSFNQHTTTAVNATTTHPDASEFHSVMFSHQVNNNAHQCSSTNSLFTGWSHFHYHPDPHLICLKLGKRQYFEDATSLGDRHVAAEFSITKRNKPYCSTNGVGINNGPNGLVGPSTSTVLNPPVVVPRCQVEGCHVALVNAKDYHRRHKVCEMHSKAPNVVVLGLEQRFCQQCSRFHAVSEFDDTKRSCRRRLAGHNERRRKSSHDHSGPKTSSQQASTGRALSLLSLKNDSSISSSDLSSRSSAALHELIAEHRAAILYRQLILDRDWHWQHHSMYDLYGMQSSFLPHQHQMFFQ